MDLEDNDKLRAIIKSRDIDLAKVTAEFNKRVENGEETFCYLLFAKIGVRQIPIAVLETAELAQLAVDLFTKDDRGMAICKPKDRRKLRFEAVPFVYYGEHKREK